MFDVQLPLTGIYKQLFDRLTIPERKAVRSHGNGSFQKGARGLMAYWDTRDIDKLVRRIARFARP